MDGTIAKGVFMEKVFYVYLTTNKINGKQYIGQHYGKTNDKYYGSGLGIMRAIKEYGKENFSKQILQVCDSREDADKIEKFYIEKYDAVNNRNFYNMMEGGTGGDGWRACQRWQKEHPKEAAEARKVSIEKLRQWTKDPPEEQKKNTEKFIDGARRWRKENPDKAKECTRRLNEGKQKWQTNNKEQWQSQIKQFIMAGSKANSKKVLCVTTGKIFESICEASRFYGTYQPNITKCLKGERHTCGIDPETGEKLVWAFCD